MDKKQYRYMMINDNNPYRDSERGHDEAEEGARGHVLRVVLIVRDPGEGGEHREEGAAHLDQRPDQPEVPGGHPLVEEDNAEPHAVGGEAGVPRHPAEPHVVHPHTPLRVTDPCLTETREVCDKYRGIWGATHCLSQGDVRVTHLQEVRPQTT